MWTRRFFIGLLVALTTLSALATPRNFPVTAKRGVLSAGVFPQVVIDGQAQTLAPGAKILGEQNTIIMPSNLMNKAFAVNYTVDRQGFIDRVWILTSEELAQSR